MKESGENMDIILWRHADAEEGTSAMSDMDRQLTAKGMQQAALTADWLRRYLPKDTTILVSPARRAIQTVEALGQPYELKPELAPNQDARRALAAVGWPAASSPVLIVGHQPMLGQIAALLMSGSVSEWKIKKGAVWWLSGKKSDAGSAVAFRAAMDPALLQAT